MIAKTTLIYFFSICLGKDIIQGIQETTQNLQTGIGSFIEKNLPPFSSAYKENNCLKKFEHCEQPYSFIHKVFIPLLKEHALEM